MVPPLNCPMWLEKKIIYIMLFLILTRYLSLLIHSVYSIVHIDIQKIVLKNISYVNNSNPHCADNV